MKKGATLYLLLLLITQTLTAQITGNIKLIDTHGDTLTDHSGIKVYFEPRSGSAVSDSTTTDVNGYFSYSPAAGSYYIVVRKQGYLALSHGSASSGWISTPNDIVPNKVMYEKRPLVYVPAGNVSGTWTGDTIYIFSGQTTIAAGDTLNVTNGAVVSSIDIITQPLLGGELIIDGHLNITGNDSTHTIMASLDSSNNVFDVYGMYITVNSGGSIHLDNADLPGTQMTVNDGDLVFNNYNYREIQFLDQESAYPGIIGDLARISITNSNFFTYFELNFGSILDINCSQVSSLMEVNNDATLRINGCLIDVETNCNNCDSIISKDNLYVGTNANQTYSNNTGTDPSYISIENCFGYSGPEFDISGDIDLDFVNNGIQCDGCISIDPNVNVQKFDYNLLLSSSPSQAPVYIVGGGAPAWALNGWSSATSAIDTFDSHGNRYFDGNLNVQAWLEAYPPDYDVIIGPGYNLYCIDMGDPNILDPDGTRSDIGARNIYNCTVPLLTGQTPIPTVADSVYPGDANHDGVANNFDILPIGLKYLYQGPTRPGATTNWVGQDAPDWNDSLASGVNSKHVDCDGDGQIGSQDINAVYLNYGLTHNNPKRRFAEGLWYQFPTDSIFEGDTIEIGVMLGRAQAPVNDFYGMAFTMLYDSTFIKPGTAKMTFDPCWVGTDSVNMISFFREDTTLLKYDAALVSTDGQNITGFGPVGTLSVVMNDDIQAKDESIALSYMDFQDILAINFQEQDLEIGGERSTFNTFIGYDRTVGLKSIDAEVVQLFPNPANNVLHIKNNSSGSIRFQIVDLSGALVLQGHTNNKQHNVDISELGNGLYMVKLSSDKYDTITKLSIIK